MQFIRKSRAILGAVVFASALSACSGDDPTPSSAAAREVQVLPQASIIQGRDGGQSGLAWGHSVWTFGDTVLNAADAEGSSWHHNSFSITNDTDAENGIKAFFERSDTAGAPRYFIAPTLDEATFNAAHSGDPCAVEPCGARFAAWPGPPVFDAKKNRAFVFYGLVYAEPGDFNFEGVGQSVAVWSSYDAEPERPLVAPDSDHPTLLFGKGEPPWGSGAIVEGDTMYAFACDSDHDGLSPPCSLARVATDHILDRSAWRYFDGDDWDEDADDATTLFSGAPTVSIAKNDYLGRFVAVYCVPMSNDVVMRVAPSLTGPWSDPELLFVAKKEDGGAYDASLHPEYNEGGGKVMYVTYSRPNHQGWAGSEFALERIELP